MLCHRPEELRMSTFVIVPGAWDTPATMEPLIEPLESGGHAVVVVDLPCADPDATLEEYADAVRAVLPDDLTDVVLVGYSFGGFTASRIAVEHPDVPVVYLAAWIPREGASVLDLFAGGDPFEAGEEAGFAAIDTDHGPFREQPDRLAEMLVAASADRAYLREYRHPVKMVPWFPAARPRCTWTRNCFVERRSWQHGPIARTTRCSRQRSVSTSASTCSSACGPEATSRKRRA
jgi:pimeloyl-ACP methyl ester carboxylesterase